MCRPKEVTAGEGESTLLNYLAPSFLSKRKSRKCTHHSETSSDVVMTALVEGLACRTEKDRDGIARLLALQWRSLGGGEPAQTVTACCLLGVVDRSSIDEDVCTD